MHVIMILKIIIFLNENMLNVILLIINGIKPIIYLYIMNKIMIENT